MKWVVLLLACCGAACGELPCAGRSHSLKQTAPLIRDIVLSDVQLFDPERVNIDVRFLDADADLAGGTGIFYIRGTLRAYAATLADSFADSLVTPKATSGVLKFSLPFQRDTGTVKHVGLDVQFSDGNGARSNCYEVDLYFP